MLALRLDLHADGASRAWVGILEGHVGAGLHEADGGGGGGVKLLRALPLYTIHVRGLGVAFPRLPKNLDPIVRHLEGVERGRDR